MARSSSGRPTWRSSRPCWPDVRALLSWSSGKDSAHALHVLRQDPDVEVVGLLTTVNAATNRVAMHAVRRDLLDAQAEAVGLPLLVVPLPFPCPNDAYETAMAEALQEARARRIEAVAFGIFRPAVKRLAVDGER